MLSAAAGREMHPRFPLHDGHTTPIPDQQLRNLTS